MVNVELTTGFLLGRPTSVHFVSSVVDFLNVLCFCGQFSDGCGACQHGVLLHLHLSKFFLDIIVIMGPEVFMRSFILNYL